MLIRIINNVICSFVQIAVVLGFSIIAKLFRSSSDKVKSGIKREQFILLINLGYDQFKSSNADEIDDYVAEEKLIELIPEGDYDVIRALLSWDFTDEMELENDEFGMCVF